MTTPTQFRNLKRQFDASIQVYRDAIDAAYNMAQKQKIPDDENLVHARSSHIVEGQILWYKDGDEGAFWAMVIEVLAPADEDKAFISMDGCRYGVDGAFVDIRDVIS